MANSEKFTCIEIVPTENERESLNREFVTHASQRCVVARKKAHCRPHQQSRETRAAEIFLQRSVIKKMLQRL